MEVWAYHSRGALHPCQDLFWKYCKHTMKEELGAATMESLPAAVVDMAHSYSALQQDA